MIIAKLMGGLGNQLFQYAFGRVMAWKHGVEFKVDISGISGHMNDTNREFAIVCFDKDIKTATETELKPYKKNKLQKAIDLAGLAVGLKKTRVYVREPHFHFSPVAASAPSECYLDGYWQSEKYFAAERTALLKLLCSDVILSEKSSLLFAEMKKQNSVSIHVRKGDYIQIAKNKAIYEELKADYYERAMVLISGSVKDPVFYVFSDEPDWFRKNVKTDIPVNYVTHNAGKDSYQDLFLMSRCRHNIIANSSFSWWGAWLNDHPGKIVIAPEKWFKDKKKDTKDLIPESWIRL